MTDPAFDVDTFQRQVIEEFRARQGRVGGPFAGATLALLTTVGARTGLPRTSPLAYLMIDGLPVVVASAMGADKNPDWYHNVLRNPAVTVETGRETYQAVAVAPTGADRDALFAAVVAAEPGFGDYQRRTTRPIPVVTLIRIDTSGMDRARGLGDFVVESHDWLRDQLDALRHRVDGLIAGDGGALPAGLLRLGPDLRKHCLEFCDALKQHHIGEDQGAFPMLAQRYPALRPLLNRLGAEHEVVARLQDELRTLIDAYEPGSTDPARLRLDLERLATRLEEHFRYEEQAIVRALNSLGPTPNG